MLKSVSVCAALLLALAVFVDFAEARQGFGGARMGGFHGARMGGFSGARMGGFHGARMGGVERRSYGWVEWCLALLVLREWELPVQAGSLVQAGLLGQAEVIGLAAGGRAIGTVDLGAVDAGGRGA